MAITLSSRAAARLDYAAPHAGSASSVYSDYEGSRSPSPLPSRYALNVEDSDVDTDVTSNSRTPSILSYDSSRDAREMLKVENGRVFNNQSDTYYLPADEREFDRLLIQHTIHCTVLGGLYPAAEIVERVLAPEWGTEKAILDVGTGPGHWAIDMAKRFPHCQVVGVDLAPRTSWAALPGNLRLEFDDALYRNSALCGCMLLPHIRAVVTKGENIETDIAGFILQANLGFPHYHGCFDVVYSRSISNGIIDFEAYVAELGRCLRPGGVVIVVDGEPPILDSAKLPIQPAPIQGKYPETKGWMARILYEAGRGVVARGGRVLTNAPAAITRALDKANVFASRAVYAMYIPIGPWQVGATEEETQWIQGIGEMMQRNAFEFVDALRPMLKSQGFEDEVIERFVEGALCELRDLSVHMYTRWAYGYAVKPLAPANTPVGVIPAP